MSKIIRCTKTGHCFEIEGCMDAGYTIIVTVKPKDGYKFVQWLNCDAKELEPEGGYQRFKLDIKECGYSFAALFEPGSYTPPSDPTPSTPDTYQVSWNTGAGYTVSATADGVTLINGDAVEPEKSVTITVKANSGYNLGILSLSGVNETFTGNLTLKTANFTMPSDNVVATINASEQVVLPTYYYTAIYATTATNLPLNQLSTTSNTTINLDLSSFSKVFIIVMVPSNKTPQWIDIQLGNQNIESLTVVGSDMKVGSKITLQEIPTGYKAYYIGRTGASAIQQPTIKIN